MNASRAVGYLQRKRSADDAVVFFLKFVHHHKIGTVTGIVIDIAAGIGIGDQETVSLVPAGSITDKTKAETALLAGSIIILTADKSSVYIVHFLRINNIDRIADQRVIGCKRKRRGWSCRGVTAAFVASRQDIDHG